MAHYRIHISLTFVHIMGQINPVQAPTSYFLNIPINLLCPCAPVPSNWSLSFSFPHQNPECNYLIPIRSTCSTHLILLHLITLTIFSAQYRTLRSSLCSFLHSPFTLYLLAPNILLSTLFPHILKLRSSFSMKQLSFAPIQTIGKIS